MIMLNNIKQGFLPTSKALYLHSCTTVFLTRFSIQRIILGQISTENPIVKKNIFICGILKLHYTYCCNAAYVCICRLFPTICVHFLDKMTHQYLC